MPPTITGRAIEALENVLLRPFDWWRRRKIDHYESKIDSAITHVQLNEVDFGEEDELLEAAERTLSEYRWLVNEGRSPEFALFKSVNREFLPRYYETIFGEIPDSGLVSTERYQFRQTLPMGQVDHPRKVILDYLIMLASVTLTITLIVLNVIAIQMIFF